MMIQKKMTILVLPDEAYFSPSPSVTDVRSR